jgi:hypothetical protein
MLAAARGVGDGSGDRFRSCLLVASLNGAVFATSWVVRRIREDRALSDAQIHRSVLPDRKLLGRYAELGRIISDDNQRLQYSQLRAGLAGARSDRVMRENTIILSRLSGRASYQITRRKITR